MAVEGAGPAGGAGPVGAAVRAAGPAGPAGVLGTAVGSVRLASAVMTASGTAGHGTELAAYGDLSALGAVVVKSLAAFAWPGSDGPRVLGADGASMLNRVGLQGPGVRAWLDHDLPRLEACGAAVVASIWGRTVEEFADAARLLAGARGVVAVEVNVSCPNLEDRSRMFAHSPAATAEAVQAAAAAGVPRWAKLSPNAGDLVEVAGAALGAGAEALTLTNTLLGLAVDVDGRRAPLAGGLSGEALHPVSLRAVWDCRAAFPEAGIVGAGGVDGARRAVAFLMAGADAVQVGTATFADPRAPWKVQSDLARWCARRRTDVRRLVGAARG